MTSRYFELQNDVRSWNIDSKEGLYMEDWRQLEAGNRAHRAARLVAGGLNPD